MTKFYSIVLPFAGFYNTVHEFQLETDEDIDFVKAMNLYAEEFTKFVKHLTRLDLEFEKVVSPKYYNFETDRVFAKISEHSVVTLYDEVDTDLLRKIVSETFKPHAGFIPHYNNNLSAWDRDLTHWDHNQLLILLQAWLETNELDEDIKDWYLEDCSEIIEGAML